ncbi:MAG: hypothetical protein ABIK65_13385 [Candidatus Eisenbacteria bacterium]
MRMILVTACVLCLALPVMAVTVTADFEGGVNNGNWTFYGWSESINPNGGNPGGWLSSGYYWAFWPICQCEPGAADFTGDYVAMGVTRLSGDFTTPLCENQGANGWPFTVLLRNDMGTPDIEDDVYVYPDPFNWLIPQIGEGWTHYDFDIPSDFVGGPGQLPAGWLGGSYLTGGDIFPSDVAFQEVIGNVTTVEFHWNHPAYFTFDTGWEVGADNITIEYGDPTGTEHTSWGDVKAMFR